METLTSSQPFVFAVTLRCYIRNWPVRRDRYRLHAASRAGWQYALPDAAVRVISASLADEIVWERAGGGAWPALDATIRSAVMDLLGEAGYGT